ncbi:Rid family detoxifying hydrolase [Blattabacterium cuenoti]|uniref:Rid family detoxifying hydrolase n=1 Tax=Blattabacterium cuenoti TaxID=1653831 RepID=UPI00163CB465|nr:Rid family detoxifying hydrolase [Blattabacterium cuenoti]
MMLINKNLVFGPYQTYILINNFLFVSGQIAINIDTNQFIFDNIEKETDQIMKNLEMILSNVNMNFNNVVKTSLFIKNMNNLPKINVIYSKYFINYNYPARETIEVSQLPKNANIEISLIACKYKK